MATTIARRNNRYKIHLILSTEKMQDYIQLAEKNGVSLKSTGPCQFCGAKVERGIHECLEIFSIGFENMDFSKTENHIYRFLMVDAHTLQHPEIHGRWNNHFHLSRLHLIFEYDVGWTYKLSPQLSAILNHYKIHRQNEYLNPPAVLQRGPITSSDIKKSAHRSTQCKKLITEWAKTVYKSWHNYHAVVDRIAQNFLEQNSNR